jgi:hypothetical protein
MVLIINHKTYIPPNTKTVVANTVPKINTPNTESLHVYSWPPKPEIFTLSEILNDGKGIISPVVELPKVVPPPPPQVHKREKINPNHPILAVADINKINSSTYLVDMLTKTK